jgi:hypothetical protein
VQWVGSTPPHAMVSPLNDGEVKGLARAFDPQSQLKVSGKE